MNSRSPGSDNGDDNDDDLLVEDYPGPNSGGGGGAGGYHDDDMTIMVRRIPLPARSGCLVSCHVKRCTLFIDFFCLYVIICIDRRFRERSHDDGSIFELAKLSVGK